MSKQGGWESVAVRGRKLSNLGGMKYYHGPVHYWGIFLETERRTLRDDSKKVEWKEQPRNVLMEHCGRMDHKTQTNSREDIYFIRV